MFTNLIRMAAHNCVDKGRRILARLQADPRLAESAAEMRSAQEALEVKVNAFATAVDAARTAEAFRDEAGRNLENRLREFALNVLSVTRNHHDSDLYLRYFPDGYGDAVHLSPSEMLAFAEVVLGKLAEETDPWIVSFRERIATTRDALAAAEETCQASLRARKDARKYVTAEKRLWLRGLTRARLKAQEACLGEKAYVRLIFAPARPRRRNGAPVAPPDEVPTPAAAASVVGIPTPESAGPSRQTAA